MPQHYRGPSPQGKTPRGSQAANGAGKVNGARGTSRTSGARGSSQAQSAGQARGGSRVHGAGQVRRVPEQGSPVVRTIVPSSGSQRRDQRQNPPTTSQYSRSNPNYQKKNRKGPRGKKIAIAVVLAVLVVFVGAGTAAALWVNNVNETLTKGQKSATELDEINDVLVKTTSFDEPFYMMLIGSDARADDESMGARSDTNIVVRVDPTTNSATLVSIPRDTMINIDGYGYCKFNAAYSYGGAALAIKEANELLGVNISHYAEVDFDSLIGLVDTVGGVDVTVDQRINDPDADGSVIGQKKIIIEAGEQHMDGETALVFARSRAYVDGDFTRTANQRKLIAALAEKILSMPLAKLPGIVQTAAGSITTDMSVTDLYSLATQFQDGGELSMTSCMVPSITGMYKSASYVFCDEDALATMMQTIEAGGDASEITGASSRLAQQLGVK